MVRTWVSSTSWREVNLESCLTENVFTWTLQELEIDAHHGIFLGLFVTSADIAFFSPQLTLPYPLHPNPFIACVWKVSFVGTQTLIFVGKSLATFTL